MDWRNSVLRVAGRDPTKEPQGTCFAVARGADGLLVVTGWHVVETLQRDGGGPHIQGRPCQLISDPGDNSLDLAVLQVPGLPHIAPLALAAGGRDGLRFLIYGFGPEGRRLGGKLRQKTPWPHPPDDDVAYWDYYLDEQAPALEVIKRGYSGAPVYDPEAGKVVAVVTRRVKAHIGSAIDVGELVRLYPGAESWLLALGSKPDNLNSGGEGPGPTSTPQAKPLNTPVGQFDSVSLGPTEFRDPFADGSELGPEMVWLPEGVFAMGSPEGVGRENESPAHQVQLGPYAIGKYPLTLGEFRRFCEASGYRTEAERGDGALAWNGRDFERRRDASWRNPYLEQEDRHPVVCVSWNDAKAYCDWLSERTDRTYGLPTEAQWEYAGRAGEAGRWCCGDEKDRLGEYAWYAANAGNGTHGVGAKSGNAWGLWDLHGNVWEWCADWYADDTYSGRAASARANTGSGAGTPETGSAVDPGGPGSGSCRIIRGGGWLCAAYQCRSSYRNRGFPSYRDCELGFRLCRTGPWASYPFASDTGSGRLHRHGTGPEGKKGVRDAGDGDEPGGDNGEPVPGVAGTIKRRVEPLSMTNGRPAPDRSRAGREISDTSGASRAGTPPGPTASASADPEVYVSYAWRQERIEPLVDKLIDGLGRHGIRVVRDLDQLQPGDRIYKFQQRLSAGPCVILVLSAAYLRSDSCMTELHGIWVEAKQQGDVFLERIVPLTLADADIGTVESRLAIAEHWKGVYGNLESRSTDTFGVKDFERFKRIGDFYRYVGDMLWYANDKLAPRDLAGLSSGDFKAVKDMIDRACGHVTKHPPA